MERVTPKPNPNAINQLEIDGLLMENLELTDRVADLESDCKTYKMLACAALENVAQLTERNKVLAKRIDNLTEQLRELMGCTAPSRQSRERERAKEILEAMRAGLPAAITETTVPPWKM
jgi:hypothetical protein